MIYTVGLGWSVFYLILTLVMFSVGIGLTIYHISNQDYKNKTKPVIGIIFCCVGLVFLYLWIFAATHFRVAINERALLINTVNQTIIGVRESGVQNKPFIGVSVDKWTSNTQYPIPVIMKGSVQSATTQNGTPVFDDVTAYFDLSNMDIASAYQAVNGKLSVFLEKNLLPGLLSVSRNVSSKFLTTDHTFKRDDWQKEFEKQAKEYLSDPKKGFGVRIVEGRTVLSWDFVNDGDKKAFDDANRAAYKVTQNQNEKAALEIESQMVDTRNDMLSKTASGTVVNLQKMSEFMNSQPAELRPYLIEYLASMADMEYLRIVGQQKPELILPPHGSVIASPGSSTNNSMATPQTDEKSKKP